MGQTGNNTGLRKPRVAVTLGDPSGIGPELVAKLLSNSANLERADIYLLADRVELDAAIADAGGLHIPVVSHEPDSEKGEEKEEKEEEEEEKGTGIRVLDDGTSAQYPSTRGEVSRASGARCIHQLQRALGLVQAGEVDAVVFAPLNKSSLKAAGMTEEDELRWFANRLGFAGTTSEINIAGPLWTARVTSHIGIEEVAARITKESTLKAIELLHRLRWESGIETPRLAVCALNPHNGENGAFGTQEITSIRPAVTAARERGIDVDGPWPCDTIFLKREHYDGIVTMYHDQGQIAMKLLSFDGGVTVQGGLPVPIATPAHGTAFDIAGKNLAAVTSTQNAFDIAVTMAERRIAKAEGTGGHAAAATTMPARKALLPSTAVVEIASCC